MCLLQNKVKICRLGFEGKGSSGRAGSSCQDFRGPQDIPGVL